MTHPRSDLLAVVAELSTRYPNWRLGQLVANLADWADRELWDVEDEQLLEAALLHLQQLDDSSPPSASVAEPAHS
ncbi:MAG: hypothetical protein ACKV0T_24200 [Planctomycetales bacterium]